MKRGGRRDSQKTNYGLKIYIGRTSLVSARQDMGRCIRGVRQKECWKSLHSHGGGGSGGGSHFTSVPEKEHVVRKEKKTRHGVLKGEGQKLLRGVEDVLTGKGGES